MSSLNNTQHKDLGSQPGSSRRPQVSFGPTLAPAVKPPPTTEWSRTRLATGSLPPQSQKRNTHHLPKIPPFPAPPLRTPSPTVSNSSASSAENGTNHKIQEREDTPDTPVKPTSDHTARPDVINLEQHNIFQVVPLHTRIREMERQIRTSHDVIMPMWIHHEQASLGPDDSNDFTTD